MEQKAYYRKLAAQDKKRYQREMEEWKAKLAEQDADVELVAPKSIPAKNQILTGSVVMDDIFTPTPQEKVESGNFKPQDMMHAMPTEDLIMLAKEFVEFNRYNTKLDYGEMCELEKHIKELIDRTTDYEIRIINVETNIGEKRADELREKIRSADKTLKKEMQELAKKNRLGFT